MPIKKVCAWIILATCGGILNAQIGMLERSLTVMEATELKIERGTCLVYWKPVYCLFQGSGYRLEVLNGTKRGKMPVRSYSVSLDGRDVLAGLQKRDPAANWEGIVHLEGRSILKVTLRGEPGAGIVMRIWGEAGKVHASHVIGSPQTISISPQTVSGAPYGSPQAQSISPQQAQSAARMERPQPTVSLQTDKDTLQIGQVIRLTWDAQNAATVQFTSCDMGRVEKSGSALVWPEKDTLFRIEARDWGNTAAAEVMARVEVPAPELKLNVEPKTIIAGQEITMTWKTKNACMVRYGEEQLHFYLPLSGKKSFKPTRSFSYIVQAENGEKSVQRTISVKVLDREMELQRIEREKTSRNIPKDIDKALRGIWAELKKALRAGDAEKAASLYCYEKRAESLELYKAMKDKLPQVGVEMRKIEFLEFLDDGAKYRTKRKETIQGKEYDISYYVYFVIDQDGQWRIYKF